FQYLADKYAHATPEIVETLAKLQLPPHTSVDDTSPVPLPHRRATPHPSHQIALLIRDGRRMANKINSVDSSSKTPSSSRQTSSHPSQDQTSMSTALEQDFTVEGKKGNLQCPFSKPASFCGTNDGQSRHSLDTTPHHSADPICAAMLEEATSQATAAKGVTAAAAAAAAAGSGSSKCPIRFMDKHSPEEIAHYVETHKHALPRSHEVCLRRYQRNEMQMKKMDSKYGNIVSMIEGLSHIHQPMLPDSEGAGEIAAADKDGGAGDGDDSNERVEHWAHGVSEIEASDDVNELVESADEDRTSHFERPLKEVRVGESPSRPWGISVPVYDVADGREDEYPLSPPPAPVRMSNSGHGDLIPPTTAAGSTRGKCPFDHGKSSGAAFAGRPPSTPNPAAKSPGPIHGFEDTPAFASTHMKSAAATDAATAATPAAAAAPPSSRPTFINPQAMKGSAGGGVPQMVFTGPVFIGYPMEQAVEFMNQYRGG
ncbi:hypothetical protein E4U55_007210, partial [Claviceps digitariae]